MAAYPSISEQLVRMFEGEVRPGPRGVRRGDRRIRQTSTRDLRGVSSLDQDNILRHLLGTVEAIVGRTRTSRTAHRSASRCRSVFPKMPKPMPLYEVWVSSTEMEAMPAGRRWSRRGGMRWSDRREDFRTEVLGLMKAQKVKNAINRPGRLEGRLRAEADRDRQPSG